ncbi:hypothetical protein ZTR_07724 [Talaromyces verruculosus]|nr:hypothetical protein ZTR_07724 [Talaromyces verruculosus]
MGRQPYIVRLALGRSPYEPPDPSESQQQTSHSRSTDGYVQQYDERGHPIFPESKALARELRRAKNDVLSTMGVVVSGEAGRTGNMKDKKSFNAVTAENDYGLVIVAFDHAVHFFGSWWVGSLSRRIQTFKSYTNIPLIRLFKSECRKFGWPAEFFAGMPLWAARIILPICRTQLFEPLLVYVQDKLTTYMNNSYTRLVEGCFSMIRSSARLVSFVFFEQLHMFCILQTLHLIPHKVYPRPAFLLPFTKYSLIRIPSLPSDLSLVSLGQFASQLAATPFAFAFVYVLVRPYVEEKIYRLIRRHLPKQERPDEVSIQVAMENDLLEWTLPIAGRRTEEETRRSNLSLLDDIKEEFRELQKWLFRRLGYNHDDSDENVSVLSHNDIVTVREDVLFAQSLQNNIDQIPVSSADTVSNVIRPAPLVHDQTLTNEQLTHSPGEITPNAINEVHPAERAERGEIVQDQSSGSWIPFQDNDQDSRADTLFSRPRTPESPLASPRIRASLTHQNSFTTTMELSLQDSRSSNRQDGLEPVVEIEHGDTALGQWPIPLDESQVDAEALNQVRREIDELEQLAAAGDPEPLNVALNPTENERRWETLNTEVDLMNLASDPVLPHVVEEPLHSPTHPLGMDALSDAGTEASASNLPTDLAPWRSPNENRSDTNKQRVTVLSSYPADALAHHLASLISGIIFMPFESFFYRSLARSYESSPLAAVYGGNGLIPHSDIRDLTGFAGGGGRRDMIAYMSKLALIQWIQTGISGVILGVCSATAIGIGKRVFRWGNL